MTVSTKHCSRVLHSTTVTGVMEHNHHGFQQSDEKIHGQLSWLSYFQLHPSTSPGNAETQQLLCLVRERTNHPPEHSQLINHGSILHCLHCTLLLSFCYFTNNTNHHNYCNANGHLSIRNAGRTQNLRNPPGKQQESPQIPSAVPS